MDVNSSSIKDLPSQIKRAIGNRILACFLLVMLITFALTIYDVINSLSQLEKDLSEQCKSLQGFATSQALIDNPAAIQAKLDALNHNRNATAFIWDNKKSVASQPKLRWRFPLSWMYVYPINNTDDGTSLGAFVVTGSLLYDHMVLTQLLTKVSLLLAFFILIFIVLFPLGKRIPQQLFITPVNDLLALLRNGAGTSLNVDLLNNSVEINEIRDKITALLKDVEQRTREAALGQIATQVAHDIRSPLTVLNIETKGLTSIPEKNRTNIRNAIQRVNDIANNLLSTYRQGKNKNESIVNTISPEPAAIMLESIVSEKRVQVSNANIEIIFEAQPGTYNAFVNVNIVEFKRVLSNIINNSIDALSSQGKITITLDKEAEQILITIADNGCGIPQEKLPLVLEEGASFGKKGGSGLGLPYAINKISEWHGDYCLRSEPGKGTQFEIILPECKPSEWFRSEINIERDGTIVVLDDDAYIHQIWDGRFPQDFLQAHQLKLIHFNNPHGFIEFCKERDFKKIIFLLDYELGQYQETGLSLAKMLNLGRYATLVTSRYEDEEVRENCKTLGMKIIPKTFAELTPIRVFTPAEIIFIDDEEIITEYWKDSAESAGKSIRVFNDPYEFMSVVNKYPKEVLIYIDSSLGADLKGEDFAKILYEQGYQNIILATGYDKSQFKDVTWVRDVVGKEPPWG